MSTQTKPEYVTDVRHEADCNAGRTKLYLYRQIAQAVSADVLSDEDDEYIATDPRAWVFEEQLEPVTLCCGRCDAQRYVVIDKDGLVIALTRDNCPRSSFAYGHYMGYDYKPCEYCGYAGKGGTHVQGL